MDIRKAYPSKYLRAADITGPTTYTVRGCRMEQMGSDSGETKPVVYFREIAAGLVVNRSNSERLLGMLGPDTAHWVGRQVTLTTAQVPFRGQTVASIQVVMSPPAEMAAAVRVAHPEAAGAPAPQPAKPLPAGALDDDLGDDELPF